MRESQTIRKRSSSYHKYYNSVSLFRGALGVDSSWLILHAHSSAAGRGTGEVPAWYGSLECSPE